LIDHRRACELERTQQILAREHRYEPAFGIHHRDTVEGSLELRGRRVMSRVGMPKRRAVSAWPSS
jgi:hypothetical protein